MQGGATLQDQDAQWSTDNHDGHDNAIHGVCAQSLRARNGPSGGSYAGTTRAAEAATQSCDGRTGPDDLVYIKNKLKRDEEGESVRRTE